MYYINICVEPGEGIKGDSNIIGLVDTGAENSVIILNVVNKFKINYEKCRMTICTVIGMDSRFYFSGTLYSIFNSF